MLRLWRRGAGGFQGLRGVLEHSARLVKTQRNTFLEAARPVLGPNGIIRQCFSQLAMSASVPLEQLLNPDVQPSQYELSRLALDGGLESMDLKNAVAWLERWSLVSNTTHHFPMCRAPLEWRLVVRRMFELLKDEEVVGSLDAASVANMWEAFVHVRYSSDATEKEVQRLLARIGTDRIGLRHFTAPQLSKMAYVLTPSEPVERGVLGAIRDECLRQTLQRCRAGDIGRLLSSFCYADSKPDADMLEACVERASRRGFLARDSTPKDVATLLWGFKQAQHPPSDAITKKVVELGSQPSFLSGLDVWALCQLSSSLSSARPENALAINSAVIGELRRRGLHHLSNDEIAQTYRLAHYMDGVAVQSEALMCLVVLFFEELAGVLRGRGYGSFHPRHLISIWAYQREVQAVCDEAWRRELEAAVIDSVRREGAAGLNGYPLLDVLMLSSIATPFVGRDVVDCILRELPAASPTPAILRSAIKRVADVYEQHGYVPDRRDVEWLWSMDLLSDIARFKPYSRLALGLRYFPYPVPAHVLSQLVKALEDAPHDEVVPRSRFVNGILAACNKGGTEEHRAVTRSLLDALWSYWAAQPVEQGGGEAAAEGARGEGGSSDRLADGEGGTAAASTGLAAAEDGGGGSSTGRRSVGGEGERGSASSLSWDEQGPEAAVFREDRRVGGKRVTRFSALFDTWPRGTAFSSWAARGEVRALINDMPNVPAGDGQKLKVVRDLIMELAWRGFDDIDGAATRLMRGALTCAREGLPLTLVATRSLVSAAFRELCMEQAASRHVLNTSATILQLVYSCKIKIGTEGLDELLTMAAGALRRSARPEDLMLVVLAQHALTAKDMASYSVPPSFRDAYLQALEAQSPRAIQDELPSILSACARLGGPEMRPSEEFIRKALPVLHKQLTEGSREENEKCASRLIYALGRLNVHPSADFMARMAALCDGMQHLTGLSAGILCRIVYGFAALGHDPGQQMLDRVALSIAKRPHQAPAQEVTSVVGAYVQFKHNPPPAFLDAVAQYLVNAGATPLLAELDMEQLADLMVCYGRAGRDPGEPLLRAVASVCVERLPWAVAEGPPSRAATLHFFRVLSACQVLGRYPGDELVEQLTRSVVEAMRAAKISGSDEVVGAVAFMAKAVHRLSVMAGRPELLRTVDGLPLVTTTPEECIVRLLREVAVHDIQVPRHLIIKLSRLHIYGLGSLVRRAMDEEARDGGELGMNSLLELGSALFAAK